MPSQACDSAALRSEFELQSQVARSRADRIQAVGRNLPSRVRWRALLPRVELDTTVGRSGGSSRTDDDLWFIGTTSEAPPLAGPQDVSRRLSDDQPLDMRLLLRWELSSLVYDRLEPAVSRFERDTEMKRRRRRKRALADIEAARRALKELQNGIRDTDLLCLDAREALARLEYAE